MKKMIFFDGGIETQNYFSMQLAHSMQALGHEICFFNLQRPLRDSREFFKFIEPGNTIVLCFNYHGFSGEYFFIDGDTGHFIWDDLKIPVYNIVVDHPYYYHKFLIDFIPSDYTHISIDRNHDRYMERFFPDIKRG
ncbi:MAG: glycosyltransferase family 1 protein, partial [Lachnospiraceae bacterium]|nr:glycosyltransferase family 1 protein [Lachnospiraceae bacterium]